MTMYEFKILCDDERMDVLHAGGVYIGKRMDNNLILVIYQLHSFYVEITYRKYRYYVHSMRCSENTAILDPYMDQIVPDMAVKWG